MRAVGALTLSLVAVEYGEVVGHAAFSPVTIDGKPGGWFGLGPVAVRPARQRIGAGTALVRAGLAQLRCDGASGCVVLGDPLYYRRFGFAVDPAPRYPGLPAMYFQRLAFGADIPRGGVAFHPAFGAGSG